MELAQVSVAPQGRAVGVDNTIQYPRARSHRIPHHVDSRRKKLRRYQVATILLAVTLSAVTIGGIGVWGELQAEQKAGYRLAGELRSRTGEVERLRGQVAQMTSDIQSMVRQRLPGLRPLQYDAMVPIGEKYVKNVSFTKTGVGDKIKYEYRLVVENRSSESVTPEVRILLFDKLGIQVGSAEIDGEASTSEWADDHLAEGEARAYASPIPLTHDAAPEYFLVTVK